MRRHPTMQQIADYEVLQQLGEGSQGQYWAARPPARLGVSDGTVAVKTMVHAATDAEFARLARHLQLYASVHSPCLHRVYDVGQQGNLVYIAGEYIPEGSLTRPARPFSRVDVLRALADAALGAHALHEVGIAHRAIRPGNVILAEGRAKLADVGVSHLLSPGQTITGAAQMGAIEYLSPEIIQGQPASRASDIWALGATLHKVLTGISIYPTLPGSSLVEALRFLLNEKPAMGDALRNGERRIIESAVAADPADRPATAEELAASISEEAARQAGRLQA